MNSELWFGRNAWLGDPAEIAASSLGKLALWHEAISEHYEDVHRLVRNAYLSENEQVPQLGRVALMALTVTKSYVGGGQTLESMLNKEQRELIATVEPTQEELFGLVAYLYAVEVLIILDLAFNAFRIVDIYPELGSEISLSAAHYRIRTRCVTVMPSGRTMRLLLGVVSTARDGNLLGSLVERRYTELLSLIRSVGILPTVDMNEFKGKPAEVIVSRLRELGKERIH